MGLPLCRTDLSLALFHQAEIKPFHLIQPRKQHLLALLKLAGKVGNHLILLGPFLFESSNLLVLQLELLLCLLVFLVLDLLNEEVRLDVLLLIFEVANLVDVEFLLFFQRLNLV